MKKLSILFSAIFLLSGCNSTNINTIDLNAPIDNNPVQVQAKSPEKNCIFMKFNGFIRLKDTKGTNRPGAIFNDAVQENESGDPDPFAQLFLESHSIIGTHNVNSYTGGQLNFFYLYIESKGKTLINNKYTKMDGRIRFGKNGNLYLRGNVRTEQSFSDSEKGYLKVGTYKINKMIDGEKVAYKLNPGFDFKYYSNTGWLGRGVGVDLAYNGSQPLKLETQFPPLVEGNVR